MGRLFAIWEGIIESSEIQREMAYTILVGERLDLVRISDEAPWSKSTREQTQWLDNWKPRVLEAALTYKGGKEAVEEKALADPNLKKKKK